MIGIRYESTRSKIMATWDMVDPVDYLQENELLTLVQSIKIQNQELFKRQDKFVFTVLEPAC